MRMGSKTEVILHFDPLSAILDLTGSASSKLLGIRGVIAHQPAKFENNRQKANERKGEGRSEGKERER